MIARVVEILKMCNGQKRYSPESVSQVSRKFIECIRTYPVENYLKYFYSCFEDDWDQRIVSAG